MKYTTPIDICRASLRDVSYSEVSNYGNLDWIYQQYVDTRLWANTHWITIL